MFKNPPEYDQLGDELMEAAKSGNSGKIVAALKKGADINYRNENDDTPLLQAIRMQDLDTAQLLLDRNAIITEEVRAEAARENDPEITALLVTTAKNRADNYTGPNQNLFP